MRKGDRSGTLRTDEGTQPIHFHPDKQTQIHVSPAHHSSTPPTETDRERTICFSLAIWSLSIDASDVSANSSVGFPLLTISL